MFITVLLENTTNNKELINKHGLSLFIKTEHHNLLFDMGPDASFAQNAEKLGVNIASIDMAMVSHGHYDHGGGLDTFFSLNKKAKVYISQKAFARQYSRSTDGSQRYIGLNQDLPRERFIFTTDRLAIDNNLELFSIVQRSDPSPHATQNLLTKSGNILIPDPFHHEMNLIIKEKENVVLIAGCAHCGISNIIKYAHDILGVSVNHAIGGFHLYVGAIGYQESKQRIEQLGEELNQTGISFYTCHCTGVAPYKTLRQIMGEKITYISTGDILCIE